MKSVLRLGVFVLSGLVASCATSAQQRPVAEPTASAAPSVEASAAPSAEATASAAPSAEASAAPSAAASDVAPPPPQFNLPAMPTNLRHPPRPWASMNAHQKDEWMEQAVLPAMRALFREYDPQHFGSSRCSTCHGANARQVRFHMPNTLPALQPWGTPEARAQAERDPRMMAFMGQRVVPVMAELLGVERYNPQTHQGFGCMSCHPSAQAAAGH